MSASSQSKAQAPKAPPRAPTCFDCGAPAAQGQFLCASCVARKAQPRKHAPPTQQVYYPPPAHKSSWLVRLIGGVGVAYLCWVGFNEILVHKATSPADPLPELLSNTSTERVTLDSVVRPVLNQSDRDIDTMIGVWRQKVLGFEGRYGYYDPWEENHAVKSHSNAQIVLVIELIPGSWRTLKALQDLSRTATAHGQTSAARYQHEIRDKFPLYCTESGWQPSAPNRPNDPNDWLPQGTPSDYHNLVDRNHR